MMVVRQRTALSGFAYDAHDAQGTRIGAVTWPKLAQARNARLQWHGADSAPGEVSIEHLGSRWRVGVHYLRRGFNNDARYTLDRGPASATHAVAERLVEPGGPARQQIIVREPFDGRIVRVASFPRKRHDVMQGGRRIGGIDERGWLMLTRELVVDLPPSVDVPTQLFFVLLVVTLAYA